MTSAYPQKTRELHNHHFDSTIWNDFKFRDDDIVIAVDTSWQDSVNRDRAADYVTCSEPHSRQAFYHEIHLQRAGEDLDEADIHGEWMGIVRFANAALPAVPPEPLDASTSTFVR